jgi:N-ethylmaleimide reductase
MTATRTVTLFDPLKIGGIELNNRIIMAPMTRARADDEGIVADYAPLYYRQRAGAGLIITEGTFPSPMGKGYVHTPGIHSDAQVSAWRKVTQAVHDIGGKIFLQIMFTGRISLPEFLPGNATPVAPSAVAAQGETFAGAGMKPFVTPRALETDEIPGIIADYKRGTERAFEAGFDGVELHAASGYLPMQFLSSGTNQRTDQYGGSVENRIRFVVETLEVLAGVRGADRVGIKISPEMPFNDISDANSQETYTHLVRAISPLGLAYLHVGKFSATDYHALLRPLFAGPYFAGSGLTRETAEALLAEGKADATVFGNLFIANPDLPERFRHNAPLNAGDKTTYYVPGPQGYIDYPSRDAGLLEGAAE